MFKLEDPNGVSVPYFLRMDAFSLWPGAVFAEDNGEWSVESLQVVQRIERVHDTEKVVVWFRDLNYAVMDENSAPGLPGREDVDTFEFSIPMLVFGNVVNPDDFDDNNIGIQSY